MSRLPHRLVAFILVTLCVVAAVHYLYDPMMLKRISSMSPDDLVAHQQRLHHHSYLHLFLVHFIGIGLYIAAVDFVAYILRLLTERRTDEPTGSSHV